MATPISAFAFAFSGVSFYETVLKRPKLAAFVPPVMHYARDSGGDIELFAIPLTVLNDGARTGTVLAMELDVTDMKSGKSKNAIIAPTSVITPTRQTTTNCCSRP